VRSPERAHQAADTCIALAALVVDGRTIPLRDLLSVARQLAAACIASIELSSHLENLGFRDGELAALCADVADLSASAVSLLFTSASGKPANDDTHCEVLP
jgi:hypothetical protein